MTTCIIQGAEDGHIKAENAAIQVILSEIAELRGLFAFIPLMHVGRMPLAYVHFVDILVTFFIQVTKFRVFTFDIFVTHWFNKLPNYLAILRFTGHETIYNNFFTGILIFAAYHEYDFWRTSGIFELFVEYQWNPNMICGVPVES